MSRPQRLELLLFIICLVAFSYFNQGGGWNQNARFAEVRAIVEQGRLAIDDYLVYKRNEKGDDLERIPVTRAEYTYGGKRHRLCWVDMEYELYPIGDRPLEPGVEKVPMIEVCCSGDLSYVPADGHFHPNKPAGTTFLAVPGYFVIYHVERWLGVNPDHWWYMNLNAWLTSVCSVGLISALGCVLFFRIARELCGALLPALLATLAFAFGTTFFPFSTLLFDHDLTAALYIATYYFLRRTVPAGERAAAPLSLAALAGFCAGLAVLTNYLAAIGVVALGLYALLRGGWNWRRALVFCAGGIGPAVVLGAYGWACYGSPFKFSNDFQNPLFRDDDAFLGMFMKPHTPDQWWLVFYVFKMLVYSPFRGVFFFAPVLIMSLGGLVLWLRERRWVDTALCLGVFVMFFIMNTLFNGYHAGFSAGPRYLIPGLPFLALPLATAFRRWRGITSVLAVLSIGINLLLTATDAQNPAGVGGHARVEGRRDTSGYNLLSEYAWPLFVHGTDRPLLEQQRAWEVKSARARVQASTDDPQEQARLMAEEEARIDAGFAEGKSTPYLLGGIRGPVSVNPIGSYEGFFDYKFFDPGTFPNQWASFNVGEFLWAQSRWSLLPLLLVSGGLAAAAIWLARRTDAAALPPT